MKLLFTGDYKTNYNRNYTLLCGLKERADMEVDEFPFEVNQAPKAELAEKLAWADIIYMPPFTHKSIRFIRSLTKKPIVFDPLISNYMSKVYDFKKYSKYSPRAFKNYLKEKKQFHAADIILSDTDAHGAYLAGLFRLPAEKFHTLPIGAITNLFKPGVASQSGNTTVGFYGSFIPLQGIDKIMDAAILLKDTSSIKFQLIGEGRLLGWAKEQAQENKLTNVEFLGWQEYEKLAELINGFDIALGIFGDSIKTNLVIPNKIYHYAACGKTILTKNTTAIKEVFLEHDNVVLTDGSGKGIADKIRALATHGVGSIGRNAAELIQTKYNDKIIAERFVQLLKKAP